MSGKENMSEGRKKKIILAPPQRRPTPLGDLIEQQTERVSMDKVLQKPRKCQRSMSSNSNTQIKITEKCHTKQDQPQGDCQVIDTQSSSESLNKRRHQRLAEITDRCVEYKRRFMSQLESQLDRLNLVFKVTRQELDYKFQTVISSIQTKRQELLDSLTERQGQLHDIFQQTNHQVQSEISQIMKAHVRHQQLMQSECINEGFERDISQYADSIHNFYEKMKKIESGCEKMFSQEIFSTVSQEAETFLKFQPQNGIESTISFTNSNIFLTQNTASLDKYLMEVAHTQRQRMKRLESLRSKA